MLLRGERPRRIAWGVRLSLAVLSAGIVLDCANADDINYALIQAYQNNPQLNAQRAAARAIDEGVATALAGYRPRVTGTASVNEVYLDQLTRIPGDASKAQRYNRSFGENAVSVAGVTATQTLFNGFQTGNRTRQAESQVLASRETLRTTEQLVLLNAVTAYMNLLRDTALRDLQVSTGGVLEATLRQTRDRFNVGEVTRTDVAQPESRLAQGRSQLLAAESNYITSRSNYRQVIGVEAGKLAAGTPVDRFSPRTLQGAVSRGLTENPAVTTASYNIDAATLQVKIAEGALYPTVTATASATKTFGSLTQPNNLQNLSAQAGGTVSVPLYAGGS